MISEKKALEYAGHIMNICDEHNIPTLKSTVRDFVIESLEKKSRIAGLMGLTEENNFRRYYPISLKDSDIFIWCEALQTNMKYLLEQEYLNFPICCPRRWIEFDWEKNTVTYKNTTVKITKLLMKMQEKYSKGEMDETDTATFDRILNELAILADCFGVIIMDYKKQIDQNGLARIFDFLKNENGYAIFSINPVDIMTASYNTTFSSCFRPNGEYGASVLSMARDSYTATLYTIKNQNPDDIILKKYGRRWIHFSKFFDIVEFSRRYGVISPETTEKVKNDIFGRMGKKGVCVDRDISLFSTCNAGCGLDIFVDEDDIEIFADETFGYMGLPESTRIEPVTPICLHCGSMEVGDNSKWVCHECFECYICYVCGRYGEHTLLDVFGGVCDHCLDVHFDYCDGCETYHNKNEYFTMYDFPGVGDVCLTWLTANGYNVCGKCSSIKPNSQLDKFPLLVTGCNTVLCKDCQEDEVVICDDCGEKHHKENMIFNIYETGDNICVGCSLLRMPYKGCSVCGSGSFRLKRVDQRHDQHEDTHFFIAISSLGFSYRLLYTGRIAEVICSNCQTEVHYDLSNGAKKVGERRFNSTII